MPRKNRSMRERARDYMDLTKDRFNDARESAEDFVSENPIKSVMIAAAVGAAIGAAVSLGVSALVKPRKRSFAERMRDYF